MKQEIQELLDMQENLKEMESAVSRAQGEHDQLMKSLKDEFNLTNLGKAKKTRDKMVTDLENDKKKLNKGIEELRDNYEWEVQ